MCIRDSDGNGGILPDTGMPLLKAAHVTVVKRPQSRKIGLYALLLLLRRHVGSHPVEPVTDLVKMTPVSYTHLSCGVLPMQRSSFSEGLTVIT